MEEEGRDQRPYAAAEGSKELRRPYEPPELRDYGSVHELTLGELVSGTDTAILLGSQ